MNRLGMKVRDRITGFEGIITGHVVYISGCNQDLVNPRVDADGKLRDSQWFDEQRLELVPGETVVVLDNVETPGCDAEPPKR